MKTRRNKLYHNLTKKKHKKFSRKKKTYKNKTLRGGNPIIIASAAGAGVATAGAGWWLIKRARKKKPQQNTVVNKYEDDDDKDIEIFEATQEPTQQVQGRLEFLDLRGFTPPHMVRETEEGRQPIYEGDEITLTCENIKEQTEEIFETYYYTNEHFQNFTRELREINDRIDNPRVGGILLMHDDFLETEKYKKQIKSYEILGAYKPSLDETTEASNEGGEGGQHTTKYNNRQQILYKDAKNYYCGDNGYQIDKDFIINIILTPRAKLGGSRLEPPPDKILDYLTIDGVVTNPSIKGKMEYVFRTLLSYFLPTVGNTETAALIFDFYNENILLHDSVDFDIIRNFILNTSDYKHAIKTEGTNARKKIELLNLISSNTICKFLMDYVEQQLSSSEGIRKKTQIYELVSESIRINWRINNIYGDNEEEQPLDGHNLYLKEGEPRDKYLINPVYVGGAGPNPIPTRGTTFGFEPNPKIRARYYIPFIKIHLKTLVSKKQIPYEVLIVLLGLILSDNEDIIEGEKILAVNIIYNEIVRYGSQDLYDVPIEGSANNIPKQHRDQAHLMLRPVTAIPNDMFLESLSNKTIIPAYMATRDIIPINAALENYLMTNLKFGEFVEKYFTTLVHNCRAISVTEAEILKIQKKALYSIFYFTLKRTDGEWERKGKTTIDKFDENLKILLPKVNFSMFETPEAFNERFARVVDYGDDFGDMTAPSMITPSIRVIIMNRSYKLLKA